MSIRSVPYASSLLPNPFLHHRRPKRPVAAMASLPPPHPSLNVTGGGKERLLPAFKTLHEAYSPFPLLGQNRHVETIFAAFFRSMPDVRYKRECLRTVDDGAVAIDWVTGDHLLLPPDSPILILMWKPRRKNEHLDKVEPALTLFFDPHGLTGGSQDTYVKHMLVRARNNGWRVVAYNGRSGGNSPVTTPQFYSASFIGDLRQVVAHVSARYPGANLYAVGWSLGANILVNYLGQESQNCPLTGAVSLCNPFNLVIADENLRKGLNVIYDNSLKNALCTNFKKHAALFEDLDGDYNLSAAANPKTVREYDEALTRVTFGFKSVDEYYSRASSSNSMKYVRTPLLCIQAADDPVAPAEGIPREDIKENPYCMLIETPNGGHLGWVAGPEAPTGAPWTDAIVMDFLEHLQRDRSNPTPASSDQCAEPLNENLHSVEA